MAVGDVYNVQYSMVVNDKRVTTDLNYEETSPRLGTIQEVSNTLAFDSQESFWTVAWRPFVSDQNEYDTTWAQMIYPTRQKPEFQVNRQGEAGSVIAPSMNGQTAVLVAEYGVTWNREFQGRAFLPGAHEGLANDGRLTSVNWALVNIAVNAHYLTPLTLAGPAGGTYTPVVLSPKRLKAATPPVVNTLGSVILRARISRQGRRKTDAVSLT